MCVCVVNKSVCVSVYIHMCVRMCACVHEAVCTSVYKWKGVCASGREGKPSDNAVTTFKTEK